MPKRIIFPDKNRLTDRLMRDINSRNCAELKIKDQQWLHMSYHTFCKFFLRKKGKITRNDLIIGTYFSYGWMPTMLELSGDVDVVVRLVNKASKNGKLNRGEIASLRSIINNSLVGTSKLLHFVNPQIYPIWDSRVCSYIFDAPVNRHRTESIQLYLDFQDFVCGIHNKQEIERLRKRLFPKQYQSVSTIRTIEYFMYLIGKQVTQKRDI